MNQTLDTTLAEIAKIDGWLETQEIRFLYTIACDALKSLQSNEICVEIGSWKGKSTATIALACKHNNKGILYAIDPCKNTSAHTFLNTPDTQKILIRTLKTFQVYKYVKVISRTSEDAYARFSKKRARLVFIDGDHEYASVYFDTLHWEQTLVSNGYLLLHDTVNHSGPRSVFFQLLKNTKYAYIGTCKDLAVFQKVNTVSIRQWCKKLYALLVFKAFFKIYIPAVS